MTTPNVQKYLLLQGKQLVASGGVEDVLLDEMDVVWAAMTADEIAAVETATKEKIRAQDLRERRECTQCGKPFKGAIGCATCR